MIRSIEWCGDKVRFLDQTALPNDEKYVETSDINVLAEAIVKLKVRGAPLIGISAAYGTLLGLHQHKHSSAGIFLEQFHRSTSLLEKTRPTAKNLFWALERMRNVLRLNSTNNAYTLFDILESEAKAIHDEDRRMCESMGIFGAQLIESGATILTHCNSGSLATGGIGTGLGVIKTAHKAGKKISVYVDETRPLLQGARLTMCELEKENIPATLITDNSAAWTIKQKNVDVVIVGADRVVANGDTANKIGTYNLAILAKEHGIHFYVVIPTSTIDLSLTSGNEIQIEERGVDEVASFSGLCTAPKGAKVFAPAFDVTPNDYITAIVTEKGIHRPPYIESLRQAVPR
ncbi:MAG: S-methyl-5-thioribose-1-phosphate isomerase [Ignavibacteriales bacterium]|nr:S-methyl-5-thioribose-1-phosphate isomerase [Ignavibacteriales bacterium]